MVDADCVASRISCSLSARRYELGQMRSNQTTSPPTQPRRHQRALRYAGFVLVNTVRPRAKSKLHLSVGLLGTGMAFPARTLETVPWDAFSVTEDREYHVRR